MARTSMLGRIISLVVSPLEKSPHHAPMDNHDRLPVNTWKSAHPGLITTDKPNPFF